MTDWPHGVRQLVPHERPHQVTAAGRARKARRRDRPDRWARDGCPAPQGEDRRAHQLLGRDVLDRFTVIIDNVNTGTGATPTDGSTPPTSAPPPATTAPKRK